ncbi:hypothetical protein GQ457_11G029160 [Hibiscus cannabinus]
MQLDLMQLGSTFIFYNYSAVVVSSPSRNKVGGPIFYRWMYPIEMFFCKLKYYYRNKRYPERSIVEGYLVEEFHTKSRERLMRTKNYGVFVTSSTTSYDSARDNNPMRDILNIMEF